MEVGTRLVLLIISCFLINTISSVDGFTLPLQSVNNRFEPITNKRQILNEDVYNNVKVVENCNDNYYVPANWALDLPQSIAVEPCLYVASNLSPAVVPIKNGLLNPQFCNPGPASQIIADTELRIDLLPSVSESPCNPFTYLEPNLCEFDFYDLDTNIYYTNPVPAVPDFALNQPELCSYLEPHLSLKVPVQYSPQFDFVDVHPNLFLTDPVPYTVLDIITPPQYTNFTPYIKSPCASLEGPPASYFSSILEPSLNYQMPITCQAEIFDSSSFQSTVQPSEIVSCMPFDYPLLEQQSYFEVPCNYPSNPFGANFPISFLSFEPPSSNLQLNVCFNIEPDLARTNVPCNDLSNSQFLIPLESYGNSFENINAQNIKREISQCCDLPITSVRVTPPGIPLPMAFSCPINNLDAWNYFPSGPSTYNNILAPLIEPNFYSTLPLPYYDYEDNFIPTPSSLSNPCIYPSLISGIYPNLDIPTINPYSIPVVQGYPDQFNIEPCVSNYYSTPLSILDSPQVPYVMYPETFVDLLPVNLNPYDILPAVQTPQANLYSSSTYAPVSSSLPAYSPLAELYNAPILSSVIPYSTLNSATPMGKYFQEARSVSAKLNEFISSFNNRLSLTSTVRSPRTLSQPNIASFAVSPFDIPTTSSYGCDSNSIFVTPLNYENGFISAPQVPMVLQNDLYKYPVCSSSVPYNNFQESISALSYSNFLPIPYSCQNTALPSYTVDPSPYYNLPLTSIYSSTAYQLVPENPFLCKTAIPTAPLVPKIPWISRNFDQTETSLLLADILSSISLKGNALGPMYTKAPAPFLTSVSSNMPYEGTVADSSYVLPFSKYPSSVYPFVIP